MAIIDNQANYYKFDINNSTQIDSHGTDDLTVTDATFNASGKINGDYNYNGTTAFMIGDTPITGYPFTINGWVDTTATAGTIFELVDPSSGTTYLNLRMGAGGILVLVRRSGDGSDIVNGTTSINDGTPRMVTMICRSATDAEVFINASTELTATANRPFTTHDSLSIGRNSRSNDTSYLDGNVDEVGVWSADKESDLPGLFNGNDGLQYPYDVEGDNSLFFANSF